MADLGSVSKEVVHQIVEVGQGINGDPIVSKHTILKSVERNWNKAENWVGILIAKGGKLMSTQQYTTKGGQTLWRCDVWVDGKTITRRGFSNKREAAKAEREIRNLADKKMSPTSPRLTLGEYLEDWYAARPSLKPKIGQSQYKRIREHLNNVIPELGLIKVKDLKYEDVSRLREKLQVRLANRTIKQMEIILKGALQSGVKRNLIPVNPIEHLSTLPINDIIDNKEIEIFEPDEQRRLIEAARSYAAENDLRDFIRPLIGLHTGARSGKIAGLQWKHVNFKEKTIRIEQSLEFRVQWEPKTLYTH